MEPAFIIIIIGLVLIFIVLIVMLFDPTLTSGLSQGVGGPCNQTSDCRSGLACIQGVDPNYDHAQCLIPQGGSCFWQPNFCLAGLICHNEACVPPLEAMMSEEAAPLAPPTRLMTPMTQAVPPQGTTNQVTTTSLQNEPPRIITPQKQTEQC